MAPWMVWRKKGRPKFDPQQGQGLNPGTSDCYSEVLPTVPTYNHNHNHNKHNNNCITQTAFPHRVARHPPRGSTALRPC